MVFRNVVYAEVEKVGFVAAAVAEGRGGRPADVPLPAEPEIEFAQF